MDPYLEQSDLWPEVHSRLIVAIADAVTVQLSERYRVAIEKRTYLAGLDEAIAVGIPDVAVVAKAADGGVQPEGGAVATVNEPVTVLLPEVEEVQERYLEVREVASGAVITTIEVLSPKNKRAGEGRQAYLRKRNQVLASLTHLVEIDLLRSGQPLPMQGAIAVDYRVLVSRSEQRPAAQLYGVSLRQRLPCIPIPLRAGEPEPVLDLQAVLGQVYERGRYHLAIDYGQPLSPLLSDTDATWVATILSQWQ